MDSLLKTVGSMTGSKKKALIKDSLKTHLSTSVVEMQSAHELGSDHVVSNCDEATSLCAVLEAVFLHGLKDSLLNRVTQALSGPDYDSMPQPSFWGPLLVFSHRQLIKQIQSLSQITTEVGYCRAWIRQTLNDGMLANYLCYIKRDNSALKPYYNHWAYVRDPDLVEVAQRYMETLDHVSFTLACNSSLLNIWSNTPLLLAGIWSPPMKSCPIVSAVDIAKTITNDVETDSVEEMETISIASSIGIGSFNSSQSAFNNIASITEDRALKIILANNRSDTILSELSNCDNSETQRSDVAQRSNDGTPDTAEKEEEKEKVVEKEKVEETSNDNAEEKNANVDTIADTKDPQSESASKDNEVINDAAAATVGNSLGKFVGKLGWSTSFDESSLASSVISESGANAPRTPGDGSSYEALIESYQNTQNTPPEMREFMNQYSEKRINLKEESKAERSKQKVVVDFDAQLCYIPREKGLDIQDYTCLDCGHPIGMIFSKAHVCSYSGHYFCSDCMAEGVYVVPSRMIHNWDLKQYSVSRKAAEFLEKDSALINLKTVNPKIYMAVDIMAQLQSLRIRLNLLRAYLFTCREPIIESLQQKVSMREYLYDHVHQYAISDLLDIPNGILAQQLQKVVEFAKDHVMNCWLCKQKGFICEICDNPRAIYPFDLESTFRCGKCNGVYHAECLDASKPCPRCIRKRNRIDLPLLNIGCTNLQNDIVSSSPERIETK
ncbi:hypothetical protein DMN91_002554 [Ooceraea biroi]|uniref:RUN domain-containing protein n=1 Tax=Ooceraea biroi TaxID=2015173 RepID=A0A3L8DWL3_OOCBI|nr:uncharacterized protein LOC105276881 [Ooceraea biroi]RLU24465.1 hypothetical protein DMN91_002554 [Ooceraea biroi]